MFWYIISIKTVGVTFLILKSLLPGGEGAEPQAKRMRGEINLKSKNIPHPSLRDTFPRGKAYYFDRVHGFWRGFVIYGK